MLYYGGFLLAAVVAMVATAGAAQPGRFADVLSVDPLVAIGRLSYGLYLWHWPVFVAMRETNLRGISLLVTEFAITFAFALASFVLVEQPIRTRRFQGASAARRVGFAFGGLALATALGTALFAATANPIRTDRPLSSAAPITVQRPLRIAFGGDSTTFTFSYFGDISNRAKVDSLAWAELGCGFLSAERINGIVPDPECAEWPARWNTFVNDLDPEIVVAQFGQWEVGDMTIGGVEMRPGDAAYGEQVRLALDHARAIATRRGGRLMLLDVPCNPKFPDDRGEIFNQLLADYAAAHAPDVPLIRWSEFLCPAGKQAVLPNGRAVRHDGVHFDERTAPVVVDWLLPRIKAEAEKVRALRDAPP
jgi:hypothetical protein